MSHESATVSSHIGLIIAIAIISCWFASLIKLLTLDTSQIPLVLIILGAFVRSFLHTGLFITTHEAIHGLVSSDRQINNVIGHITSFLYALLPYKVLTKNHRLHHCYPASNQDPDFYASNNFLLWYLNFMKEYQRGRQAWILVIGMAIIFCFLICLQISPPNIFLFWVIPIIVSSLQLFTFGIFLPHRQEQEDSSNRQSWHYYSTKFEMMDRGKAGGAAVRPRVLKDTAPHIGVRSKGTPIRGQALTKRREDNYQDSSLKTKLADCYRDRHQAKTIDYSVFWSFITCYHFGYHWEHHQYPYLPWYKLPLVHQQQKNFPLLKKKKYNSC